MKRTSGVSESGVARRGVGGNVLGETLPVNVVSRADLEHYLSQTNHTPPTYAPTHSPANGPVTMSPTLSSVSNHALSPSSHTRPSYSRSPLTPSESYSHTLADPVTGDYYGNDDGYTDDGGSVKSFDEDNMSIHSIEDDYGSLKGHHRRKKRVHRKVGNRVSERSGGVNEWENDGRVMDNPHDMDADMDALYDFNLESAPSYLKK